MQKSSASSGGEDVLVERHEGSPELTKLVDMEKSVSPYELSDRCDDAHAGNFHEKRSSTLKIEASDADKCLLDDDSCMVLRRLTRWVFRWLNAFLKERKDIVNALMEEAYSPRCKCLAPALFKAIVFWNARVASSMGQLPPAGMGAGEELVGCCRAICEAGAILA
jgi:hypothetical protein